MNNKYTEYTQQVYTLQNEQIACLGCILTDSEGTLTDLYVHPSYRGRGIATSMMWHLAHVLLERDVRLIEWSDCSDRYRAANNLYTQLGAEYVYPDGDPTMVWTKRQIQDWLLHVKPMRLSREFKQKCHVTYI